MTTNSIVKPYIFRRFFSNEFLSKYVNDNRRIAASTVFQGNLYEYTVSRELSEKLQIKDLEKIGGSHDKGVDLKGRWPISDIYNKSKCIMQPDSIDINQDSSTDNKEVENDDNFNTWKVLVQCKAFSSSKISPRELRELIGTYMYSKSTHDAIERTIMIMCSPNLLTKASLNLLNGVQVPIIYIRIGMLKQVNEEYDIKNSGKLLAYYENNYSSKILNHLNINQWLKLRLFENQ